MKKASDNKSVMNTKVKVILFKGKVVGKIVTGITPNGAVTSCEVTDGPIIKMQNDYKVEGHNYMAGGGMNFVSETRYWALRQMLKKLTAPALKEEQLDQPIAFLVKKGYKVEDIL